MSNYEKDFGDVDHDIARQRGVLGGEGFDSQERVIEKLNGNKQGFDFQVNCPNCGKTHTVTLGWPEILVASCGRTPQDIDTQRPWLYHGGRMYPPVNCTMCTQILPIPMTPDKADRLVDTGIKAGHLRRESVPGQVGVDEYRARIRNSR